MQLQKKRINPNGQNKRVKTEKLILREIYYHPFHSKCMITRADFLFKSTKNAKVSIKDQIQLLSFVKLLFLN